ncbi:MAG: hypothetical protein KA752_07755 [Giesbergeria sp.]|nr:hypothetical protein [Giesbergeria sp.]
MFFDLQCGGNWRLLRTCCQRKTGLVAAGQAKVLCHAACQRLAGFGVVCTCATARPMPDAASIAKTILYFSTLSSLAKKSTEHKRTRKVAKPAKACKGTNPAARPLPC